jgi:DNA-binding GntR family transcriptional regulator
MARIYPGGGDNGMVAGAARTMVEVAYDRLREEIISGRRRPGERLRVELLRQDFNLGTSTLREALSRLVADTLVTAEGHRGFRVAPISFKDFQAIADLRALLETRALQDAIARGGDEWEAGIIAAFHRLSRIEERLGSQSAEVAAEWERGNRDLHDALIAACDNPWLFHFRGVLLSQSARYLRLSLANRTVERDVHVEHQAIVEATLARDAERASRLIDEHIARTVEVIASIADDWRDSEVSRED